eukprot:GILK01002621.1.p1 GENE.GILK01002621.1~~GILK01002621.1.p1  ORF type:complete len:242 (+),score=25.18 GILK01002621.1:51-776(+)
MATKHKSTHNSSNIFSTEESEPTQRGRRVGGKGGSSQIVFGEVTESQRFDRPDAPQTAQFVSSQKPSSATAGRITVKAEAPGGRSQVTFGWEDDRAHDPPTNRRNNGPASRSQISFEEDAPPVASRPSKGQSAAAAAMKKSSIFCEGKDVIQETPRQSGSVSARSQIFAADQDENMPAEITTGKRVQPSSNTQKSQITFGWEHENDNMSSRVQHPKRSQMNTPTSVRVAQVSGGKSHLTLG